MSFPLHICFTESTKKSDQDLNLKDAENKDNKSKIYQDTVFSREATLEVALFVQPYVHPSICNANSKHQKSSVIKRHQVSPSTIKHHQASSSKAPGSDSCYSFIKLSDKFSNPTYDHVTNSFLLEIWFCTMYLFVQCYSFHSFF